MEREDSVMEASLLAGEILLESGAEMKRVEDTMGRIARHYGLEPRNGIFTISNGIFSSYRRSSSGYFAGVRHVPLNATRINRIAAVNQISRDLENSKETPEELIEKLTEVRSMPDIKRWKQIVAAGFGSMGFCIMFGGKVPEGLVAFFAGALVYSFMIFCGSHMMKITANVCGGAIIALIAMLFHLAFPEFLDFSKVIFGAIMPLVPGVAFTNGIRDVAYGDYLSGTVRLLDSLLIGFSIAGGAAVIVRLISALAGGITL